MNTSNKPRVIKDFEKLDPAIQLMIQDAFPGGYGNQLISIANKDGILISALPFETEDRYYLVKMPLKFSKVVDSDDDDFDDDYIKETSKPDLDDEFKKEFGDDDDSDDDKFDDDDDDDLDDIPDDSESEEDDDEI